MKTIVHVKLLLKITQEYVNAHFTFVFSLLFSLLFLAYSYNFSSQSWRPIILLFFLCLYNNDSLCWLSDIAYQE